MNCLCKKLEYKPLFEIDTKIIFYHEWKSCTDEEIWDMKHINAVRHKKTWYSESHIDKNGQEKNRFSSNSC